MRRQPQARGTKAKYRIDAFYELEKKAKQQRDTGKVNLDVKASYIGSKIFEAVNVSKRFGDLKITEDFNYILPVTRRWVLSGITVRANLPLSRC